MTRALLVAFALLAGCPRGDECDAETPCGFGQTCVEGECREVTCATSAQCPIESFCAPSRKCEDGCEVDGDCRAGFACDTSETPGTCVQEECEDTQIDCGYREFCNTATGECYDAGDRYCKPCEVATQVEDCGADGYCYAGYCTVDCAGGRECPSGFECAPFTDGTSIIGWQCFTYCWLYDDYDPGSFAEKPPEQLGPVRLDTCDPAEDAP